MMHRRVVALLILAALASTFASAAWAAGLTITSKPIGANTRAKPSFYPRSVVIANCSDLLCVLPPANTPNAGDTVTVVFNTVMKQSTLCSAWTSDTTNRTGIDVTVTMNNNAGTTGNDTVTVTGVSGVTCSGGLKFGSIDLGSAGYVGGTINYGSSKLDLTSSGSTPTIKLTLGGGSTGNTVSSGSPANYSCDAGLQSSTGVLCTPSKSRTSATEQF